jgi:hypothetical protein
MAISQTVDCGMCAIPVRFEIGSVSALDVSIPRESSLEDHATESSGSDHLLILLVLVVVVVLGRFPVVSGEDLGIAFVPTAENDDDEEDWR